MHLMLQQDKPDDWVVSTMKTHSVRDMCDYVFSQLGLNYKNYVIQNKKFLRPEELKYLKGDSSKIRALGWKPKYTFEGMMDEMVEHWLEIFKKEKV
jgi:GDPmannose 4,6-dehydratase